VEAELMKKSQCKW